MSFAEVLRAGWDTETTGVNVAEDRIVTASLVVRGETEDDEVINWVINPGVDCPTEASDIHGWTTERLQAEGAEPAAALEDLAGRLAEVLNRRMPLVSYNGSFDWSILHFELLRHGLEPMTSRLDGDPVTLIDAYVLDNKVDRYRSGSRSLVAVCEHYGVKLEEAHAAHADAAAALSVAERIAEKYPQVRALSPVELFAAQQRWAAERAESYQAWLRSEKAPPEKRDPGAVIDGSWPLKASP